MATERPMADQGRKVTFTLGAMLFLFGMGALIAAVALCSLVGAVVIFRMLAA